MHHCDVTNLSGGSREPSPPSNHLHLHLPRVRPRQISGNWPITLSPGSSRRWSSVSPWQEPARGAVPPRLRGSGMSTLELALALKGHPAGRAVDQRTSQRVPTLPAKHQRPASIRSATLRAFQAALPSPPRQSHSSFTSLSELSAREDVSPQLPFPKLLPTLPITVSHVTWA